MLSREVSEYENMIQGELCVYMCAVFCSVEYCATYGRKIERVGGRCKGWRWETLCTGKSYPPSFFHFCFCLLFQKREIG